jgi:hypothetical protein
MPHVKSKRAESRFLDGMTEEAAGAATPTGTDR